MGDWGLVIGDRSFGIGDLWLGIGIGDWWLEAGVLDLLSKNGESGEVLSLAHSRWAKLAPI